MTQEKDIILHSKVMDKVVDIINNNGLEIRIVKIRFPKPCHSKIIFPSTQEGYNVMIKTLTEINQAEMEYLKSEAELNISLKKLTNKLCLKNLKTEQEKTTHR
jgi:hypothetical protein